MFELQFAELSQMRMAFGRSLLVGRREKRSMSSARASSDMAPERAAVPAKAATATNCFISGLMVVSSGRVGSLAEVGSIDRGHANRHALIHRDRGTRRGVRHGGRDVPFAVRAHRIAGCDCRAGPVDD